MMHTTDCPSHWSTALETPCTCTTRRPDECAVCGARLDPDGRAVLGCGCDYVEGSWWPCALHQELSETLRRERDYYRARCAELSAALDVHALELRLAGLEGRSDEPENRVTVTSERRSPAPLSPASVQKIRKAARAQTPPPAQEPADRGERHRRSDVGSTNLRGSGRIGKDDTQVPNDQRRLASLRDVAG